MARWYDQQPGSEESLLALYDAVVAAEELDLAEQAQRDALWSEFRWLDDVADPNALATEGSEDLDADVERPTMSHAVGIVEHLLGGRNISRGEGQTA